jgi:hypothetical protein
VEGKWVMRGWGGRVKTWGGMEVDIVVSGFWTDEERK